ncbi:ABC-2 family transporter protein [Actinomyces bovis]|uniref:ABC-2 family transporter protein n=1 Tax=Actinomyces bovis TaxID=1658 RepID=A0ABY1VKR0_9ACTO|nr:ABC transporter permease [Actinomyces bovis]SPT52675.1 ABC-2 family transporter protein [Actinomyces bovis]VEG54595.1 ABC-2 family transporter protein [Actinomyces israelii]
MTTPNSSSTNISRASEIMLVAGREFRVQMLRKSSLIANGLMLLAVVASIVGYAWLSGDKDEPYRLGVIGADQQTVAALSPGLKQLHAANGQPVELVEATPPSKDSLCADAPEGTHRPDMVLSLDSAKAKVTVCEKADTAVVSGLTALLQQHALAEKISSLGGDASTVASSLAEAAPAVEALDPPSTDSADFGVRYGILLAVDALLLLTLMGGGQYIAMGVVEEKSSRIVEILLACVRPTSLLAGKILGTGAGVVLSYGVTAAVGLTTAKLLNVLPKVELNFDTALVMLLVWLVLGFLTFAALFGAAGSLVSRQEDVSATVMPLIALCMAPYMASIFMVMNNPQALHWKVLSYLPFFSPFMMPTRLVFGISSWAEQALALVIALAALPALVWLAARIYTRAVTRTGARVPLREVLGRKSSAA